MRPAAPHFSTNRIATMLRSFLCGLMLFQGWVSSAEAQIVAGHPRLVLDAATLTELRARAAANTPQWQELKAYCDSFIGGSVNPPDGNAYADAPNIGQGYQGSNYWSAVLAEGLCYQTLKASDPTGAAKYGDKARAILLAMSTPYTGAGSHGQDPCTDAGYGTRFYGVGMGLGYDWVYDRLSASDKSQIYGTANIWLTTFETAPCANFEYEHPHSNYFAGYFHAKTAITLATYGDNPYAPVMWTDWQNAQFNTASSNPPHIGVQPYYAKHLLGGGWSEGFGSYGPLATLNMSLAAREVKTGTGVDLVHTAPTFTYPVDAGKYLMHFTWPSRNYFDDRDTNHSTGNPDAPPVGTTNAGLFAHVLGNLRFWKDANADVFQQYTNEVIAATAGFGFEEPWEKFLFFDPNGATQPLGTLPLSYFAPGLNAVSARSDWSTGASWMSFRAPPYVDNPGAGEQGFDSGSLALVRGSTPLLVNSTGWTVHEPGGNVDENNVYNDQYGAFDGSLFSGNRTTYNVFYARKMNGSTVAERYGQAAFTTEDDGVQTQVSAYEDGSAYVYSLATHLEDMYRPASNGTAQVAGWSRELLYLRPGRVVVYDRTRMGASANDQFLAFHFPANPTPLAAPTGSNRFEVTYNGVHAGAMTTVLPASAAVTTLAVYPSSSPTKVWQAQVRPKVANADQRWLTVFDLDANKTNVALASALDVTSGNAVGTLLETPTVNQAVLFNSAAAGTTITGNITYSVLGVQTVHFIAEVKPNTGYSVTVAPVGANHKITVAAGGSYVSSPKGVLTFTTSSTGTTAPPPTNATVGLVSSLNPAQLGQTLTFTATVNGTAPTGTVTFTADAAVLCANVALTGTGDSRTATCSSSTLSAGSHPIVASYSGDVNNTLAASPTVNQVVNGAAAAATTTALTLSPNPVDYGQPVVARIIVTPVPAPAGFARRVGEFFGLVAPAAATPSGSITLIGDGVTCLASVVGGTAVCNLPGFSTAGTYPMTASYSGDANFAPSSTTASLVVRAPAQPPPDATTVAAPALRIPLMLLMGLLLGVAALRVRR